MGKPSARKLKRWAIIAAIASGAVIATVLLGHVRLFQLLHLKAGDLHFLVRGKQPTSNIVILAVDNRSLEHFDELMMFWHPYYAEVIRAVGGGGAKVIGLDHNFVVGVSKWEPENDAILMQSVNETAAVTPVICGFVPSMTATQKKWPVPLNILAAALNQFGFVNLTVDPDDFVRNQDLIHEQLYRSLAFLLAAKFRSVDAKIENARLMFSGRAVPITPERTITINYASPPRTFPFISISDFIEASRKGEKDRIRQWAGGKAVLIGSDLFEGRHRPPFYTAFSGLKHN